MKNNDLKKLKRADLLEILIEQGKEIERLQAKLDDTENQLKNRMIDIEKAGTLAEASLLINKVFLAADEAAKQYLDNIKSNPVYKSAKKKSTKK